MRVRDLMSYVANFANRPVKEVRTSTVDQIFPAGEDQAEPVREFFECVDFFFTREYIMERFQNGLAHCLGLDIQVKKKHQ